MEYEILTYILCRSCKLHSGDACLSHKFIFPFQVTMETAFCTLKMPPNYKLSLYVQKILMFVYYFAFPYFYSKHLLDFSVYEEYCYTAHDITAFCTDKCNE